MTAELQTIRVCYEEENMTPEEISEDRGLDLSAVKAGLMQCSSKYRKDCGKEDEQEDNLNFTKDEQQRIMDVIRDLALGADDENLRLKAAIYIRDDFKGRKDVVKGMAGQQFNILMINEQMRKVRAVTDSIKQKAIVNV
jgi:hypothetical protein